MAGHAMGERSEIEALLHRILEFVLRHRPLGAGQRRRRHRHLVDRRLHLVADGRQRAEIGDDRVEIARREHAEEARRHHHRERHAVRPHALGQRALDVSVAPRAKPGVAVGREVGALHGEERLVEGLEAARQPQFEIGAADRRRQAWRMAIAASADGVDQIPAALDGRLRHGGGAARGQRRQRDHHKSKHEPPAIAPAATPGAMTIANRPILSPRKRRRLRHRSGRQHDLGRPLRKRQRRRVGVAADDRRHDRGVGDTQAAHAAHAQRFVDRCA